MTDFRVENAPAPRRTRQTVVGLAMLVVTLVYLVVELAFNFTLVHTLGSVDIEHDEITPTSFAGMMEMGLRLTATAVTLLVLGWLAGNYANDERPFALGWFSRGRPSPWGWRSFAVSAAALGLIWFVTHKTEDKVFELQEWLASAQERQDLHIGLNATKLALVLAKEAAKPNSPVKPATLDVGDACLAVTQPHAGSISLDEPFLAQPGARPLIAAMPHLLALRWGADGIPFEKKQCEIIVRWKSQLPDAAESYRDYVAPAMHTLEEAYDAQAPHHVPAPGLQRINLDQRLPLSMVSVGDGITQAAIDTCVGSRSHVDFRIILCLWHEAHAEAARQGVAAGIDYREGYLQQRRAALDGYAQVIADKEQAALTLPDDFSAMSSQNRAQVLSEVHRSAEANQCLIDLGIVEESIPRSLEGINSCKDLKTKIDQLSNSAGERRCGLLNGPGNNYSCALYTWGNRWTPEALAFWDRHKMDDCKNGPDIVEQCRTAILAEVARNANERRAKLSVATLEPQRGMRDALRLGVDSHVQGDPALWPTDIQARLRSAANALIAGGIDRAKAAKLQLTELDTLPTCGAVQDWADALTYSRLADDPQRTELARTIAQLPWCNAYRRTVRAAGARAYEHQEALSAIRSQIRGQIAASLRARGLVGQAPEALAYGWIDDGWTPETEAVFSSRIERAVVRDIVRPAFTQRLSSKRFLTPDEVLAVLDAEPRDLRALLAMPLVDQKARQEFTTVLNGVFAYAGLSQDQMRAVGLRHPLGISWEDSWRADIYEPLIASVEKSVLRSRLVGRTDEYQRTGNDIGSYVLYLGGRKQDEQPARCYAAGHEAYYAARLPTLGLGLSVAGLLLHSGKATYYLLKLLSLGSMLRLLGMFATPLALVLTPILSSPQIVRSPLAQELFRPAGALLPWIVSAQTSYQPVSRLAYSLFADQSGHWDLSSMADPARIEKTVEVPVNERDDRIVQFKARWPEIAAEQSANPKLRKVREMLGSQLLCGDRKMRR